MKNTYPYKYGEMKMAADILSQMIIGMPSITSKNPHIAAQAKKIQDLIIEQEERK